MRPSHIYQPVMIKKLLEHCGASDTKEVAQGTRGVWQASGAASRGRAMRVMYMSLKSDQFAGLVRSIQVGRAAPLGPDGVMSGFVKKPVQGPVEVGALGLQGDEQVDQKVHGGPEKAVYAYPLRSYLIWRADYPQYETLLVPGGFGENLTIDECGETEVYVGDIVGIGTSILQVSQPRQPCFKFALRFNDVTMPRAMIRNALSGWYYRVLTPGVITAGDGVRLQDRPNNDWSIDRVNRLITQRRATPAQRAEFSQLATALRQRSEGAASGSASARESPNQ